MGIYIEPSSPSQWSCEVNSDCIDAVCRCDGVCESCGSECPGTVRCTNDSVCVSTLCGSGVCVDVEPTRLLAPAALSGENSGGNGTWVSGSDGAIFASASSADGYPLTALFDGNVRCMRAWVFYSVYCISA